MGFETVKGRIGGRNIPTRLYKSVTQAERDMEFKVSRAI